MRIDNLYYICRNIGIYSIQNQHFMKKRLDISFEMRYTAPRAWGNTTPVNDFNLIINT